MSTRRHDPVNTDPSGQVIFRTSTHKGAFFGGTPIVQPSGSTQAAVSTSAVTASTPVVKPLAQAAD